VRALAEPDLAARLALVYAFFSPELRERLFLDALRANADFRAGAAPFALARLQQDVSHLDPLSQMLYVDTRASLPDDLLMVNDKMSMAHSIEARVPYLDLPLLAFVESLPPHCKLQGLHGKFLHKKALERWLPRTVVHRRKKGFDNPVTHWLRGPLRPLVQELLFSADAAVRRYFDMDVLTRLVAQHDSGREDHMRQIYLLLSFEMWHRRFIGRG